MRLILAFLLLLTFNLVSAQTRFIARANATELFEGDVLSVEFTIENARDAQQFRPPQFTDCDVINGPNRSMRSTYINGKSSSSTTYTYSLLPTKAGTYNFQPASISIGGKKFESNQLSFKVLPANQRKQGDTQANRFYVTAEVDSGAFYIGQQINLVYKLYTQEDVQSINLLSESSYDDFYAEEVQFNASVRKEIINGASYFTKEIRRIALFPQQSGQLKIDPATFRLGIGKKDPFFGGLFNRPSGKYVNSRTEPLILDVQDPYRKCSDGFSGAVGQFEHRFAFNRATLSTDDAMRIQLEITGNGDVKTIQAPDLNLPEAFEFYGSEIMQEQLINSNNAKRSVKVFQYTFLPTKAGRFNLKLAFSYLDPRNDSCVTKVDSFVYDITQGQNAHTTLPLETDTTTTSSLKFTYSQQVKRLPKLWSRSAIFWTLVLLPWLLVGYKRVKPLLSKKEAVEDSAVQKFERFLNTIQSDNFAIEPFILAFKSYLSDQYQISQEKISAANLESLLNGRISNEKQALYTKILFQSELALYARNRDSKEWLAWADRLKSEIKN